MRFANIGGPRIALAAAAGLLMSAGAASAQFLNDGDFDALTVGTAPDCGVLNGAWGWPQNYIDALLCERLPEDIDVVTTDSFDPGAPGNSFETDISDPDPNYNSHVTNVFSQTINESDGVIVTVTFDIFVPEEGRGGGSIYVGGDHGGGGFSNASDRGPQVAWFNDGTMVANVGGVQTPLGGYTYGAWQSVQFDIDLATDTFDMFWGPRGEDMTQIADDLKFRVPALDHLDRFSWAHFGATVPSDHAYVDNVVVRVPEDCPPDLNGDGTLDLFDFLAFTNLFNAQDPGADWNGDGVFDLFDFLGFVNSFNAGC